MFKDTFVLGRCYNYVTGHAETIDFFSPDSDISTSLSVLREYILANDFGKFATKHSPAG